MVPIDSDSAGPCDPPEISPDVLDETLNRCGRTRAMTVFTPVRPGGTLFTKIVFLIVRWRIGKSDTIQKLSFIHFARWGLIRRIPDFGQPREHLRQPLFMFESNYNGTFDEYIDAFSHILTTGMKFFWGSSYGFPGPEPVAPFKQYIHANEYVAQHYYSAYPTATTTMIVSALDLEGQHRDFAGRAGTLSPEQFAQEYRKFLAKVQDKL